MNNYKRIYVVSEIHRTDESNFDGECCEVAYHSIEEAKEKYAQLKKEALKLYKTGDDVAYEEDYEDEYIQIYERIKEPIPPYFAYKKTLCVIKIEYLDLKY